MYNSTTHQPTPRRKDHGRVVTTSQLNKFIETQIRLKILHIIDMICTDYNIDKIKLIKSGIVPLAIKIKQSKLSWTKKN